MKHIHHDIATYTTWLAAKASPETHILRSRAYALLGDHKKAILDLKAAIDLDPTHADAHHHMAIMQIHRGEYAQANNFAKRSHDLNPGTDNLAWMVAAEGLRLTKKIQEAPTAALYHKRGLLALHQGAYRPAKADLAIATKLDPDLDTAFIGLATAHIKLNEIFEAERVLDDIADRKPEFKSDLLLKVKQWAHLERKAKHSPTHHTFQELLKFLREEDTIHTHSRAEEVEEQRAKL